MYLVQLSLWIQSLTKICQEQTNKSSSANVFLWPSNSHSELRGSLDYFREMITCEGFEEETLFKGPLHR